MIDIILILAITLLVVGVLLFAIRAIIFFRSHNYADDKAMQAFVVMRVGMVLVVSSVTGIATSQLHQSSIASINMMFISGAIAFLLLLLFTAQISRWLSVLAIKNDLQKFRHNEQKLTDKESDEVPKVVVVEDIYEDD